MKYIIILFGILLISTTMTRGALAKSKMLLFIPAIVTTTSNAEDQPHQIYPLTSFEGGADGCTTGEITHGREFSNLSNSYSKSVTIVEMTIIDPSTWQFEDPNLLPITLAPGDTVTYSIGHIKGYLCENYPTPEAKVKFVFSDGNFQNI